MNTEKVIKELSVPVENVQAHIRRMRIDGWWLESKGVPQWSYVLKDNRVSLRFSKPH